MEVFDRKKHFLTIKDFSAQELSDLIDLSIQVKKEKKAGQYKYRLKDKNIALIFEKTSTRTRCASTVACLDEGGHAEFLGTHDIQMGKKESIRDTAIVLGRMFDAIVFRGYKQSTVEDLARYSGIPVMNALTDETHPSQIIADFMTVKEHFGTLAGNKITFLGDARNNVANSLIVGCAKMGINISIGAPKSLWPKQEIIDYANSITTAKIEMNEDPIAAVKNSDVIYTDVWVSMGEENLPGSAEKIKLLTPYQVNTEVMKATGKKDTIFLHCLPASHDSDKHIMEVTEEVFSSKQSYVFDQAENRLHTIKAILITIITEHKYGKKN
jgi:ornithine carbamoyltransferase